MYDNSNSLNDDEKQRLREIEAGLERDDPELAGTFAASGEPIVRSAARIRHAAGPAVGILVGVITLGVALVLTAPLVGIAGFAVLVVSSSRLLDVDPAVIVDRVRALLGLRPDEDAGDGRRDSGRSP